MEYVASLSCGKDSLAMVLRLMEEQKPLTKCVFYDTGVEFEAIYNNLEKIHPILKEYGCELVVLEPKQHFLLSMLAKPVCKGKENEHYGYDWCGGRARWGTEHKMATINTYLKTLGVYKQYVGIAVDEPQRARFDNETIYPLIAWNMTEADCLEFCKVRGWNWRERDIDLYDILDRVSCWCCANKNMKELKNMYLFLPEYWDLLKGLQSRVDRPFRRDGKTIFDLEKEFEKDLHGYSRN